MAPYRDPKRYLWLVGLLVPCLPFIGGGLALLTGEGLYWYFAPIFIYGIVPVLDLVVGKDPSNPPESAFAAMAADPYYMRCVYWFVPLQYAGFFWTLWMIDAGGMRPVDIVGATISIGMVGGIAINTGHELCHKKPAFDRWMAKITLAQSAYGHFAVEHIRGHHRHVATPRDPASSRLGEGYWRFLPRVVIGSARSAWAIERERLTREGAGVWSVHNECLQGWALTAALFAGVALWLGAEALWLLALQAVVGFSLLEVVNYIEHYGLLRQPGPSGRAERVRPEHSWNNNNIVTNVLLYHLQRHSDHHAYASRAYPMLRNFDDAPQLPTGYAGMIVLAYAPPLWRWVMDRRVLRHYDGDVSRAHATPRARARFGASRP